MLFRLVRPMKRKGSTNYQFVQRIPADLRQQMVGAKLAIPVGDEIVTVPITNKTQSIRLSLRTSDPTVVKERQAGVAAYLEKVFYALRTDAEVSLNHRNAVALFGEIYRARAKDIDLNGRMELEYIDGD